MHLKQILRLINDVEEAVPRRFKRCFVDRPPLHIDSRRPGYCLRFMRTSQANASSLQMVVFVSVKYHIRCSPGKQT